MKKDRKNAFLYRTRRILFLVLGVLVLSACGIQGGSESALPAQEVEETTLPPVEVSMPEYSLSYSGELKDVIHVQEVQKEDRAGLQFSVRLSKTEVPIFTLYYHSDQGELVTVLTDAQGNKIPVAFEMEKIPENLSGDDADTFYKAQDAVNEIVASLVLK